MSRRRKRRVGVGGWRRSAGGGERLSLGGVGVRPTSVPSPQWGEGRKGMGLTLTRLLEDAVQRREQAAAAAQAQQQQQGGAADRSRTTRSRSRSERRGVVCQVPSVRSGAALGPHVGEAFRNSRRGRGSVPTEYEYSSMSHTSLVHSCRAPADAAAPAPTWPTGGPGPAGHGWAKPWPSLGPVLF